MEGGDGARVGVADSAVCVAMRGGGEEATEVIIVEGSTRDMPDRRTRIVSYRNMHVRYYSNF